MILEKYRCNNILLKYKKLYNKNDNDNKNGKDIGGGENEKGISNIGDSIYV